MQCMRANLRLERMDVPKGQSDPSRPINHDGPAGGCPSPFSHENEMGVNVTPFLGGNSHHCPFVIQKSQSLCGVK